MDLQPSSGEWDVNAEKPVRKVGVWGGKWGTGRDRVLEAIKQNPDIDGPSIRKIANISRPQYNEIMYSLISLRHVYESSRRPIVRSDGRKRTVPHFAPAGWEPEDSASINKVWRATQKDSA